MADKYVMRERSPGFLRDEVISHESEQFDYIAELHYILWRFVTAEIPHASGDLSEWIPPALRDAEARANAIDQE